MKHLAYLLILLWTFPSWAAQELAQRIERLAQQGAIPGLAVLVIREGKTTFHLEAGVHALGKSAPVSAEDKWHLGSNTNAMTATLIARAIDEGKLTWKTRVADYLGAKTYCGTRRRCGAPAHARIRSAGLRQDQSGSSVLAADE